MRARKLAGLLIAFILSASLLSGCVQQAPPYTPPIEPAPTPSPNSGSNTAPQDNITLPDDSGVLTPTPILPGEPPENITWISPGKVMIGNFFPGARAEWPLSIHNGNDWASTFAIAYREPGHTNEGYIKAPLRAQDWVIIADATPVLMPKETREVLVTLDMPEDAISPGPKWEFWISVADTTQTGMIITELCSRWLIQMRI